MNFASWLRQAESCALERSYLEVLARNRGETLVDYPALIGALTTDHVLCWPWVDGETVTSLIRRGSVETVAKVASAVLEEFFALSILDAFPDCRPMEWWSQRPSGWLCAASTSRSLCRRRRSISG